MKQQEAWKEERERGISKMIGLLKFITCGSVDDGKSTLIGHILYDSKLLYTDQEEALELDSKVGSRGGKIDYSLLLDGLMAEREQGITIDVAYRYFTTEKRSFIVADTPGHEEYTRNMAVGASFADLAVILIDASQGVSTDKTSCKNLCVNGNQTFRICSQQDGPCKIRSGNIQKDRRTDQRITGRIISCKCKDHPSIRNRRG